ncbi:hypothetical protein ACFFWD_37480 [Bradyrhizobium erythrophlei]|uniref:hypothetical protein n=1 Tax=Bradyrhizobium erythrophlei TaxID=1437360 RepID=UPI0035EF3FD8
MTLALVSSSERAHRPQRGLTAHALDAGHAVLTAAALAGLLVYAIGFTGDFTVPKDVDSGGGHFTSSVAVIIDIELIAICAFAHACVEWQALHGVLQRFVGPTIARRNLVLLACLGTALLFAAWQPLSAPIWQVSNPGLVAAVRGWSWSGWIAVIYGAVLSRAFEPFRARHLSLGVVGRPHGTAADAARLHRLVRYPRYLGVVLALWSSPVMTSGRFLLAAGATLYAALRIFLEERDLRPRVGALNPTDLTARNPASAIKPAPTARPRHGRDDEASEGRQ